MRTDSSPGELRPCRALLVSLLLLGVALLYSCATGEKAYLHAFGFDALSDSPEIDILDYRYGDCTRFGTCATRYRVEKGDVFRQWGTFGPYPRGKSLYVKWRIKETGKICEDTVDLDKRMPEDITMHRIRFVIRNDQLFVFFVPPPGDWHGPYLRDPVTERQSEWLRKHIIYPDYPTVYPDRIQE